MFSRLKVAPWHLILMGLVQFAPVTAWADEFQALNWCERRDEKAISVEQSIAGCTTMIESGRLTGEDLATAYIDRGNAYLSKGDLDHAISDYGQVIRLDPSNADAFYNRGLSFAEKGEHDKAIHDLDQVIRLDPGRTDALVNRGNEYSARGDDDHALRDYDQAILLDPKDASALYNRCLTKAEANKALETALSDCNDSIRLQPAIAHVVVGARGFVYLRTGQFEKALADLDAWSLPSSQDAWPSARSQAADRLFLRGVAKRRLKNYASGDADIKAAKAIDTTIAERYAGHGVLP
jgi:tetratricopeptide (TPR) repeat protein